MYTHLRDMVVVLLLFLLFAVYSFIVYLFPQILRDLFSFHCLRCTWLISECLSCSPRCFGMCLFVLYVIVYVVYLCVVYLFLQILREFCSFVSLFLVVDWFIDFIV